MDVAYRSTTRAWVLRSLGLPGLHLETRSIPEIGPDEVLVRMRAASLNFRDLKILKGTYGSLSPRLPVVPLSDGAGEIVSVGANVSTFTPGDRVQPIYMEGWHDGPMTASREGWRAKSGDTDGIALDYAVCHKSDLLPIDPLYSFEEAACFPCAGVTAWHSIVHFGRIRAGDTVLTMGSGGVSLFGLQIAVLLGAKVIVTSSDDAKLKKMKAMGAAASINYRKSPEWGQEVLELTDGKGVEHVLEVGGADTIGQSLKACGDGGSIGIVGNLSGEFASAAASERNIRMMPLAVGSREMNAGLLASFGRQRLRPAIDRIFHFTELKSALAYLESGNHFGKVVISF